MSLVDGLRSPHTPLRRFLDRELSAGAKPLRDNYRAQHRAAHVLLPPPGVSTEAGTVGTAIDQRLRLAFTAAAPVDDASLTGIDLSGGIGGRGAGLRMRAAGNELAVRLTETVRRLDLDNRDLPIDHGQDEEEVLARMLIAAAWYQVLARTPIGFAFTPLAKAALEDPGAFTFTRLLELPDRDLVADVTNQLHAAAHGPLEVLRARTRPEECIGGPTFTGAQITADADLVVDGLLIDLKSARRPLAEMSQRTAWQLTGYLLLDAADRYRIDTVGLYLSRSAVLASWPVDDFLALLGACRRDLTELRGVFGKLLAGCRGQADARYFTTEDETERVRQLLERLTPVAGPGCCPVCTQPLPEATRQPRKFCTAWCRDRDKVLRRRGLMPGGLRSPLPGPRKQRLDLPDDAEIVSLTTRIPR
ncbi:MULTISPECIES: hypothetical protein [unclassified Streptomyces]|uniref:hypothetical protein n=1 Tax=unclassified Streptomyces TaxID=2593676 RepID=UPI002DDC228E|nr:hypothetical protein [Streptomyces sp. NBC_01766]WSC25015.1 hypothetical protein OIE60_35790 [Streptomyces sp. NBC_01766]WSV58383.1 hypothetical protein OG282_34570 [Streptomyces sp. NBC_01014]